MNHGISPHDALRVTVFDYGAGNLHSLVKAVEASGARVHVEPDPARAVQDTDALILPGVGAFAPAAACLAPGRLAMREALQGGLPTLGICLGMQLLFDGSDEGVGNGLGVLEGRVTKINATQIPQIGWNQLEQITDPLLLAAQLDIAYYANSYVCRPTPLAVPFVSAWSKHEGDRFPASVRRGTIVGTQFHPEKSSASGVAFVREFLHFADSLRSAT